MNNEYKGLIITIPTRNRSEMAINAIKSVLAHSENDIKLIVSDNSTKEQEFELLSKFCANLNDSRLNYIKPPELFAMTKHWDWIINYLLENYNENHFVYLPDRVVFKKGAIKELITAINSYPNEIISYNTDVVWDCDKSIKVHPVNKQYNLICINSEDLISFVADEIESHRALPKMLNSVAPRSILNELNEKHGNIFTSACPDYNFAFRILANYDSIIYCEKSLIVNYGFNRSNGINFGKGIYKNDTADFLKNLKKKNGNLLYLSPIPELMTINNGIIHEYYFAKNESKNPKFKEVNKDKYLKAMEEDIQKFTSYKARKNAAKILKKEGAKPKGEFYYFYKKFRKIFHLRKIFFSIKDNFFSKNKFKNSLEAIEYLNNLSC